MSKHFAGVSEIRASAARPSRYAFKLCKTYVYLEKYEVSVRFQILFAFSKVNEK
jgi:hypothetical protein